MPGYPDEFDDVPVADGTFGAGHGLDQMGADTDLDGQVLVPHTTGHHAPAASAIKRTQRALGLNPEGGYPDTAARLASTERQMNMALGLTGTTFTFFGDREDQALHGMLPPDLDRSQVIICTGYDDGVLSPAHAMQIVDGEVLIAEPVAGAGAGASSYALTYAGARFSEVAILGGYEAAGGDPELSLAGFALIVGPATGLVIPGALDPVTVIGAGSVHVSYYPAGIQVGVVDSLPGPGVALHPISTHDYASPYVCPDDGTLDKVMGYRLAGGRLYVTGPNGQTFKVPFDQRIIDYWPTDTAAAVIFEIARPFDTLATDAEPRIAGFALGDVGPASATDTDLAAHLADTVDAHDASAVSVVPAGTIAATNVQAALVEVAGDAATDLAAHLADAVDAHDASAVSFVPTGTVASTDVQAAVAEVAVDAAAALATATSALDWKDAVRAASTAAVVLASAVENGDTVGGVVLATGDRVLLAGQAAPAENGVYTVNASGAPTRAVDADTSAEVTAGMAVPVLAGTQAGKVFVLTTANPIVLGTTGLVFTRLDAGNVATTDIGVTVQAFDAELAALAGLASAADRLPYFTGSGAAALATFTAAARLLLDDADASAMLTTLGLSAFVKTLMDDANAAAFLTTLGVSAFVQTILDDADASAVRTTIGAQASDAELAALAGLVSAANKLPYFTGSGTAALADLSVFARTVLDDADAEAARRTLLVPDYGRPKIGGGGAVQDGVPGVQFVALGTSAVTPGVDHYEPFRVLEPVVLDLMAIEVTVSPATDSTLYFGIYVADGDGQPSGAPLLTDNLVITTAGGLGVKTKAIASLALPPGEYLLAHNASVAFTCRFVSAPTRAVPPAMGANTLVAQYFVARAAAAFGNPGTAWTAVTTSTVPEIHRLLLRWT